MIHSSEIPNTNIMYEIRKLDVMMYLLSIRRKSAKYGFRGLNKNSSIGINLNGLYMA